MTNAEVLIPAPQIEKVLPNIIEQGVSTNVFTHAETQHSPFDELTQLYREFGIASPQERLASLTDVETLKTSIHEIKHALVAMNIGALVHEVSVVPEGNSLGVTTFSVGEVHKRQIIAAASMTSHVFNDTTGCSGDIFQILMDQKYNRGIDLNSAIIQASTILSGYNPSVIRKVAEMTAHAKTITGKDLPKMLKIAHLEEKLEGEKAENETIDVMRIIDEYNKEQLHKNPKYETRTRIRFVDDKNKLIVYVQKDDPLKEEEELCKFCGKTHANTEECAASKAEKFSDKQTVIKPKEKEQKSHMLSEKKDKKPQTPYEMAQERQKKLKKRSH